MFSICVTEELIGNGVRDTVAADSWVALRFNVDIVYVVDSEEYFTH
jgi:hypothetical protein